MTKFTPYPGTPAYPTIQQHGVFTEDWERMNAMNFMFIPNGLSEEVLEDYFQRCYKAFYSRPRVLWGLMRAFAAQPSYIPRFLAYARGYVSGARVRRNERFAAASAVPSDAPVTAAP